MNEAILFQTSIIAAFLAGMVALFAPCCVSYLLPAYLGSVFKERKRVLLMTLVYSLGIFVVMIPAVLGSKLISLAVFRYHEQIYLLGGTFMILVGLASLLGLKLPMPHINQSGKQGTDVVSIFTLGVFSGITSACCAPVLVGVLTLSIMSPSLWQALLIGFVYVLGMVTPLYIGAYFLDTKKVLGMKFFKRKLSEIKILSKTYPIIMGNVISFFIFTIMGFVIVYLALATDFSMAEMAQGFSENINSLALKLNSVPGANAIFLVAIVLFLTVIIKHALSTRDTNTTVEVETKELENKEENGDCCGKH
ncbi:MAG: cytochrome c biogenesis CcdA family protein [Patescibacteria group bacterium]